MGIEAVSFYHQASSEAALILSKKVFLLLLDRVKCFDLFRYPLMWSLYKIAGCPQRLLTARENFYEAVQFR